MTFGFALDSLTLLAQGPVRNDLAEGAIVALLFGLALAVVCKTSPRS